MSKKFFTLIYGDQVQAAPETKVIPAGSISTLIDSNEVLVQVKKDAEKYKVQVATESEALKEQGFKEGYDEGFKQWAEHLVKLENEIENVHKELKERVIPIALAAAKKIVGREIELSPQAIVDIVIANIKAVSQHKKITIYVNKKELDIVEQNKQKIKDMFENLESFSLRERSDIPPGGCVIETEVGIINGQMEHRWQVLDKAFSTLMQTQSQSEPTKGS